MKSAGVTRTRFERSMVALFYACFFLLFSSGRLSGGDPNDQLRASMLLASTGSLSTEVTGLGDGYNWVPSPDGRLFESHDIGAVLLMLPSTLAGSVLRQTSIEEWLLRPPFIVKAGASLTYAIVAAVGAYFLFLTFGLFHPARTAFLLSLAFVTTTPFWAFSRCAFDVLGGAAGVCLLLYASTRILLSEQVRSRDMVAAFAGLAVAGSFRYSLLPFLGPALVTILFLRRKDLSLQGFAIASVTFAALMTPTFLYNYVRMGSPLRPGTVHAKYLDGMNALTGSPVDGLYGMLLSPNWGLLFYSPQFLLLALLPFLWKRLPVRHRQLCAIWGVASLVYLTPVSCSVNWHGVVGWGSRYVVPVLPMFFLLLTLILTPIWQRHRRLILCFGAASFLTSLPPALVNWHEATLANSSSPWPEQIRYHWAPTPRQQIALWHGFLEGLQGRPLPAPPSWYQDPMLNSIVAFPDLWTFRIMRLSQAGLAAGLLLTSGFALAALWASRQLLRTQPALLPDASSPCPLPEAS